MLFSLFLMLKTLYQVVLVSYLTLWPVLVFRNSGADSSKAILAPVIGILCLAVLGAGLWFFPWFRNDFIRWGLLVAFALPIVFAVRSKDVRFRISLPYALFAAVMLQALIIGNNPLPISQEFMPGSVQPGRMIAAPSDHEIPFATADYFRHNYDGVEKVEDYFGEWGLTSRGPLVPFGINALFFLLGIVGGGQEFASIYGWLTNALVILGVFHLTRSLTPDPARTNLALFWAALSPVVLINTVFTWPKLLAIYLLLLAVAFIIRRRLYLAGFLTALSWLSHPVGALMIPALGLFVLTRTPDGEGPWIARAARFCMPAAIAGAATMAPWLAFKVHLGQPDPFAAYLLGRGTGFEAATTFQEWISPRISNIYYTLTPFAIYNDGLIKAWLLGPLNDASRWLIQYSKSLPGQLGFVAAAAACVSMLFHRWNRQSAAFGGSFIVAALFVMVVFWGYSADGLGRNSLEPVTILLIVFVCAYGEKLALLTPVILVTAAAETIMLSLLQFAADDGFTAQMHVPLKMIALTAAPVISAAILYASAGLSKQFAARPAGSASE
ncbi:hypothetical protein [Rhizobium sp. RU36D]|uniref:hypothetical protein n=1 Tax=Rhizobium sp. RU36D TaxID=1907415 RepID=UPI0009D8D629|nr:hypothetical protein [Rhizobium sp. RU36D]SMC95954.1 hypothetical protein SAMN05880593_1123 [Rhizobium sp. RU36D]